MDFLKSIAVAASGMRAQAGRMRIISENIANSESTATTPGETSRSAGGRDRLQVFFVGLPLSILIGLLFLFVLLGAMMSFFLDYAGGVMHALTPNG